MSDRIKKIKVKKADGSMTDYIPIGVDAENVDFDNGKELQETIGTIDIDTDGNISEQLRKININIENKNFHQIFSLQEGLNYGKEITGYPNLINISTSGNVIKKDVAFYNTKFTSNLTDFIVLNAEIANSNFTIKFVNCVFDKLGFQLYQKGTYIFENCIFINQIRSAITLNNTNQKLIVKNCIFKDTKPNISEWIANVHAVQAWKYNPINIYGENTEIFISDCSFLNIMAGACVYKPRSIQNLNKIIFKNNYINNTCNSVLSFETGSTGEIYNNICLNIGCLRNTGGYTTTITGVGMTAMYCIGDGELNVYNNYIENVGENGIEGTYTVIKNNIIKNTGCRINEGYTTPSTEGIYATAKEIIGNTIYNTYTNGIVISDSRYDTINICDNQMVGTNNGYGIVLHTTSNLTNININIYNNVCQNYISTFRVLNSSKLTYKNLKIYNNSTNKLFDQGFGALKGINYKNNNKIAELKNINFINVTDDIINDWFYSAGTLSRQNDIDTYYGKFVAGNQYANIHQDCNLSGDKHIAVFHLIAKSTANFELSAVSSNPAGTAYATDSYDVYSGQKINFDLSENYKDYYYCAIVRGKVGIYLYLPTANAEIDIKLFNVEFYPWDN